MQEQNSILYFLSGTLLHPLPPPPKLAEEKTTRFRGNSRILRRKVFSGTRLSAKETFVKIFASIARILKILLIAWLVVIPCSMFFGLERERFLQLSCYVFTNEWTFFSFFFFFYKNLKGMKNAIKRTNEILKRVVIVMFEEWKLRFFF